MTRLILFTSLLTSILTAQISHSPSSAETVATAHASTPTQALTAAWERAEQDLNRVCKTPCHHGERVGTEQVSPISNGYLAEVYTGRSCR